DRWLQGVRQTPRSGLFPVRKATWSGRKLSRDPSRMAARLVPFGVLEHSRAHARSVADRATAAAVSGISLSPALTPLPAPHPPPSKTRARFVHLGVADALALAGAIVETVRETELTRERPGGRPEADHLDTPTSTVRQTTLM